MQLHESNALNLGNWRPRTPSGLDSIAECCESIAATIPLVVQNALPKVQHQNMECTCKSAISRYGFIPLSGLHRQSTMDLLSPNGPRRYFAEVSWLRGSVNSGIIYVPDLHPTPFCFFWGFFLVYFWSVCSSSSLEASLRFACCIALHSCNECITSEGERRETRLPP